MAFEHEQQKFQRGVVVGNYIEDLIKAAFEVHPECTEVELTAAVHTVGLFTHEQWRQNKEYNVLDDEVLNDFFAKGGVAWEIVKKLRKGGKSTESAKSTKKQPMTTTRPKAVAITFNGMGNKNTGRIQLGLEGIIQDDNSVDGSFEQDIELVFVNTEQIDFLIEQLEVCRKAF